MATLVTGGTGFVGSNIVRALAERGHEVLVLDLEGPSELLQRYVAPWAQRISFVQGSVLDVDALHSLGLNRSIDKVVHAAYYTPGSREASDSKRVLETNIMGTINVLDHAREIGVNRFLFVSSGGIYGDMLSPGSQVEDAPLLPSRLYRISKFACERIVERYHEIHAMDTVSVRLGAPYGPMERATDFNLNTSLLFEWTGKAMRGEPIEVGPTVGGKATFVTDIAQGLCTVLDAPFLPHRLYNLENPNYYPISEVVSALLAAYPDTSCVEPMPTDAELGPGMDMDVSRIKEDFGFEAGISVCDGLKTYAQWRVENDFRD